MRLLRTLHIGPADSPRCVIVPGNDLCGEFYRGLGEALARRGVAVTALTLPGYDGVPARAAPSWSGLVEEVAAELGRSAEPAVLLGHSMGALLAVLVAAQHARLVSYLVLLEPAVFPTRWMARRGTQRYLRDVVRGDRNTFVNDNGAFPRVYDEHAFPSEMIELYLRVRRTSDVRTSEVLFRSLPSLYPIPWRNVAAPALVLTGAGTGLRGRTLGRWVARKLPQAEHRVIAGAAHWVVNEQDEAVAGAIEEHVRR